MRYFAKDLRFLHLISLIRTRSAVFCFSLFMKKKLDHYLVVNLPNDLDVVEIFRSRFCTRIDAECRIFMLSYYFNLWEFLGDPNNFKDAERDTIFFIR